VDTQSLTSAELPLVGGHRALDLVNTVSPRLPATERHEHLRTPAELIVWSQRSGLLQATEAAEVTAAWQASPAAGRRALTAVREIRESVYEVISAALTGLESAAADDGLDHVSLAWASALTRARLRPAADGRAVAQLSFESPPALLVVDRVAGDAVDLLSGTDGTRVRCCPVDRGGCGWLFLDHSRNRSRQWCAMADCGTSAKTRRLTERRRQVRAAARG
jgi:predicted RNA-binding Zn ribbon-like protein